MDADFYWTIVVAVISAGWVMMTFIRDRAAQSIEQSSAMISRLMDYDRLNIENPDIQKFLSRNAAQAEAYFRSEAILAEDIFYKAKTLVYKQLNMFDEILSAACNTGGRWSFLRPATPVEQPDWQVYIVEKLRHPLYRSILNNEQHIFGVSLRDFWNHNQESISLKAADPFIW